jgi:hypothetical protein
MSITLGEAKTIGPKDSRSAMLWGDAMRTRFLLSFAVVGFALIIPAHAQDSTPTSICDQAAASPVDQDRPAGVLGVAADQIDPKIAIPACEAAAAAAPNDPRIAFQLARAYEAAKAYEPARVQYAKAADQGGRARAE